jgi:predicted esterase YcpF (UPF0227 family)
MVLYIHGFGSSGEGDKAKRFRAYHKSKELSFLAPSLSYIPSLAVKTLEEIILTCKDVQLIGSSLGGYYSIYLANKYNLKAVLINPAVFPYERLKEYVGMIPSFYDESSFLWTSEHIKMLKLYDVKELQQEENFLLLTQKGDELLDYNEALTKYNFSNVIVEEGGSHSFENIETKFEVIEKFFT